MADQVYITTSEFDFNAVLTRSIQNNTGAMVLFVGVVRGETMVGDHTFTEALEYEAYIPMAEEKIKQVMKEIRERWKSIQKIEIIQRIGFMKAGSASIVVLCTSAHRNDGVFDAAKYGIDRVKEIVPIWKKEISPDGEFWVEGDYLPGVQD